MLNCKEPMGWLGSVNVLDGKLLWGRSRFDLYPVPDLGKLAVMVDIIFQERRYDPIF